MKIEMTEGETKLFREETDRQIREMIDPEWDAPEGLPLKMITDEEEPSKAQWAMIKYAGAMHRTMHGLFRAGVIDRDGLIFMEDFLQAYCRDLGICYKDAWMGRYEDDADEDEEEWE